MSAHIDALRDLPPNANLNITQGGHRFGVVVNTAGIVKAYDAAKADADYYKAEAEKWQALALSLTEKMGV